jgi:WXXGXW repeat (2 copies)
MSHNRFSIPVAVPARFVLAAAVGAAFAGCTVQPVYYERPPPPREVVYEHAGPAEGVRVEVEPPPLPVYAQPPCPEPGYLWTPGYWAWSGSEYYWVPGTWVAPPRLGVYWTPAYWGWVGGAYVFHAGYWGPHVGFYGGINYGGGYVGIGYVGGRWDEGGRFAYNTAVTNVNTTVVHNTYNNVTVINNTTINNNTVNNRTSFSGGPRGVAAQPTPAEIAAARESHLAPTPLQQQHFQQSAQTPALRQSVNQGHPTIAATPRPAAFSAPGTMAARPPAGASQPREAYHTGSPDHFSPPTPGAASPAVNRAPAPPVPSQPPPPVVHSQPVTPAPVVHPAPAPAPAPHPASKAEPKPPANGGREREHEHGGNRR